MKLLDELAAELSTKMPNKENVTAKLQDIDKRRHEFLELMDSLQTLYGEDKLASLAASTGDEADKMIDRVDNETKKARLFLSQDNSKESEGNNTSQSGTFESAHEKICSCGRCKQTVSSGFESQSFRATRRISVVVGRVFQLCERNKFVSPV